MLFNWKSNLTYVHGGFFEDKDLCEKKERFKITRGLVIFIYLFNTKFLPSHHLKLHGLLILYRDFSCKNKRLSLLFVIWETINSLQITYTSLS